MGTITDRASMVALMADVGFTVPRAGKDYLTVQDPDTGERWRLTGDILHDDWKAGPATEREAERGSGSLAARERRLDGIPAGELQDRFDGHCDARARYNRGRYPHVSARDLGHDAGLPEPDHALADLGASDPAGDRGLANFVALLIQSQIESMTALRGLLSEAANYEAIDRQLSESLKQAKAAEERLKRR